MNFLLGLVLGAIMAIAVVAYESEGLRSACEANLPRTQRRVERWVPDPTKDANAG